MNSALVSDSILVFSPPQHICQFDRRAAQGYELGMTHFLRLGRLKEAAASPIHESGVMLQTLPSLLRESSLALAS